jgi:glycine/serine hydroxymethyltransferase
MGTIASLIGRVLAARTDDTELAAVRDEVLALCSKFAPYPRT